MSWLSQWLKGWVPEAPTRRPMSEAICEMVLRSVEMSLRASLTSRQISVPTSTTAWCISALTLSLIIFWPSMTMRCSWLFSSRLLGSMTMYSSSIPRVKLLKLISAMARIYLVMGALFQVFAPGEVVAAFLVRKGAFDGIPCGSFYHPIKVVFADAVLFGVGGRV